MHIAYYVILNFKGRLICVNCEFLFSILGIDQRKYIEMIKEWYNVAILGILWKCIILNLLSSLS